VRIAVPTPVRAVACSAVVLGSLGVARQAAAQQLTSAVARVQLTAVVPARVALDPSGALVRMIRRGTGTEVVAGVGASSNTRYELAVYRTDAPSPELATRIWVATDRGRLEELSAGRAVVAARGIGPDDGASRTLRLRIEGEAPAEGLPVRYELRVAPTL